MSRWFCKFDGAASGPFTRDELEYLLDRGQLTAETEIRGESERSWSRAGNEFTDLFPQAAVAIAEPPPVASPAATPVEESIAQPPKAGPPPLPTEESEAERRRKQMLMGGGVGILTALIIFLLLWLLLTWGGGGFGGGLAGGGGQGTGTGSGTGSGVGPGSGSGTGGGSGAGTGGGSGAASSQASNSSQAAGGNEAGGNTGQSTAGNSGAAGEGDGTENETVEEASLDPAPPPRSAIQRFKPPEQTAKSGGSAGSGDGGFLSGGGGGSDGKEFLGVKVRGKIALVCDTSGSMSSDFPILVRELREKFPRDTPLILVNGCYFPPPSVAGYGVQKLNGQMPYMGNEFANDPHAYTAMSTTDAILFAVQELKRNTVMFNNDLQDGGSESAIDAFEALRKKKKFMLSGRSLNCEAPPRLLEFIKATGGDFKVDPLSRGRSPAQTWSR